MRRLLERTQNVRRSDWRSFVVLATVAAAFWAVFTFAPDNLLF